MIRLDAALIALIVSVVFSLSYFSVVQVQTQQIASELVKLNVLADTQRKELSKQTSELTNITLHFDMQNKILLQNITAELNPAAGGNWRHNTTIELEQILDILRNQTNQTSR